MNLSYVKSLFSLKHNVDPEYQPSYVIPKLALVGIVAVVVAMCAPVPAGAKQTLTQTLTQASKLEIIAWYSASNIEQRLQECSTAAGLTMQLTQRIKQGLSVKEAIALHTQAVSTMSKIKKEIYNDAFYSAMMLQSEGRSKEEILNFVVKQCSH